MDFSTAGYEALIANIFQRFPSVQRDGFSAGAYKPGLDRMQAFDRELGYPSMQLKSIHVAGTNGKGSVSNMLASAFCSCGPLRALPRRQTLPRMKPLSSGPRRRRPV